MILEYKITNKQGIIPNPRKHHHEQGLTCDCKQCGEEFTQYHDAHVYCSKKCHWDYKGVKTSDHTCNSCGCTDNVPNPGKGYRCESCRKLALNPERNDVTRRGRLAKRP